MSICPKGGIVHFMDWLQNFGGFLKQHTSRWIFPFLLARGIKDTVHMSDFNGLNKINTKQGM